jgi:hypothetical protein
LYEVDRWYQQRLAAGREIGMFDLVSPARLAEQEGEDQ